jgi:glyceraldehyde-3-phosphate dehydrogenase/erythrose-4-phosphate dehydrogenase
MRKIGIIGFGRIGRIHFKNVEKINDTKVIAVADPFADQMTEVFEKYGIDNYSNDFNT